jgi:gliding motility-associated-like protein
VNASGVVTFTPTANYVGDAIASYTVNDNEGATSLPATIKITLQSVNDAPVAVDDHKTTNEDTPVTLNVVLNDTDVDGTVNPATVDLNPYAGGIQNSITNEFGTWSVSNAGVVTFTPLANFNGTATAEYTVSDNEGLASNIATITIVVTPINDAPVAVNDNAVTSQNNAVTFNITANDYDVDGSINPATIDLDVTTAGNQTTRTTTQGTWSVNNQGDLTFTPATDYVGTTSITYTVRDDQNLISNVATIQMVVQVGIPSNVNPIANNDNGKTNQGIPVTINIIANDTDPDGSIDASTVDLNVGTALVDNSITNGAGTWTVSNGIVTFTPTPTFTGAATLTYVVSDNRGALSNQATITINVNASPIANNDTHATNEDTPTTINILANDTDPNGTLNVGSVDLDPATTGIQNAITTNEGVWSVNASGVLSFQPKLNYFGPATITYTVRDNEGAVSNVATVTVTVNSVNDAPVAVNDNVTTLEDTPTSFNVTTNDTDVDGTINAATVDLDPTSVGRQTTRTTAAGSWSVDNNGIVTYTPALNYNGTATITYVVLDNQNAVSNVATISVSVTPVNDAPVAVNDVAETDEDHAVTVSILSNDTDVDGTLNAASVDLNPTTTTEDKNLTTPQGTWSVSTAGVVTFTPVLNFNGTATISYTVKDNSNALSNTATISVTVNPVNDPPVAVADNASVNEDVTLIIDVLANDTDPDGPLDPATIDLDPSTPGIQNSITNPGGTWSVTTDGKVKFVPTPNFNGNTSIQYTVNDDQGATSQPVAITVNVLPVNDAPVAQNDNATTLEDTAINISILTNDSDVDGTLAANSVDLDPSTTGRQNTITTTTGTWSVNSVGVLTYTPAPNYFGTGSITYTVNDNLGLSSNIATVSVIVQPVNDAPVAANDNATTYKGLPVTFTILSNDTDIDGTLDIATIDLDPSSSAINSTFTNTSGTWVANSNGTITFTPAPGFSGNAMASYTVNDNDGATSNIATITVNVIRVNEAPLAINDVALTYVNNPISFNITLNDIDLDGTIDISSVCIVSYSSNESTRLQSSEPEGDWQLNLNGVMTFTPAQDFVGEAKIYYTISDNEGLISEEAEITVTVAPRPPVAAGIAKHSSEPILQADNSSLITYTFTVKSYGSQVINNIEVIDDLAAAIPAPMTFTIVSGSATGGLIYNNQYNGITNTNLVTSASTLGIGATATITLVIKVHPNGNPGVITNSASVTSVSNDGEFTFTDISDSGFDPDEDQDGFPSGPTESDPTTTTVIERPIITVEKTIASQPVLNNDCSYSVTFRVDIKNPGNVDFTNIVVKDNLAAGIQSPATFKVVTLSSDALSVNPNFNGTTDINLLSSNNSLFYNEIATIEYTVVITPNKSYGPYTTTVVITAKDTDGEDFHFESDPYTFSIAPQEVVIPEGFSPNGDGVNDKFEITLSCGLTAKLTVFNRWGDRVFVSSNYQNDWAGNSNFGSFLGKALPEGTYFYNCELSNGKSYSSYITIKH